jgi:hypothetical protein
MLRFCLKRQTNLTTANDCGEIFVKSQVSLDRPIGIRYGAEKVTMILMSEDKVMENIKKVAYTDRSCRVAELEMN